MSFLDSKILNFNVNIFIYLFYYYNFIYNYKPFFFFYFFSTFVTEVWTEDKATIKYN